MKERKQLIIVETQVETFEQAKELLDDLEVLNEKYTISAQISISQDQIMFCEQFL
ncbi:hypothetical protein IGI39_004043 [Enterococcus sp. AZ135]|uniref:hypothetical protein n=1 Tax=Enterococcus sp. AZ186 TaxID=2774632 RepID=UPI003F288DF7